MDTIKQFENEEKVVISIQTNGGKQTLPLNLILSLALGTLAGIALILGLFMGANYLANI